MTSESEDAHLQRRLGLRDAVVIGLGSMFGPDIFAALGPAAVAAGSGLLLGLVVAAIASIVAAVNDLVLRAYDFQTFIENSADQSRP